MGELYQADQLKVTVWAGWAAQKNAPLATGKNWKNETVRRGKKCLSLFFEKKEERP